LELVVEFNRDLKNENDYQTHTTEVIFPKLKQGNYLVLASNDSNFNNENSFAFSFIQTTNIALLESQVDGKYTYQVVNRLTGKPLPNASLHFLNENITRWNKLIDVTLTADKNGFVKYTPSSNHNRITIRVSHNDDSGMFKYFRMYHDNRNRNNTSDYQNNQVFLFTDRSIYRPSQTVYFKGIAVRQTENKSAVLPNKNVKVTLKDVNYQDVKTLELQTNEYGSFSGEFILPNSGLTGSYQIYVEGVRSFVDKIPFIGTDRISGNVSFSVEEYKRPKFSAEFNKITQTFKLNDSIKIKGKALAYAGSNITDAKVVYRVQRKVQYPQWWYWYRPYGFSSEAQEITNGETKTSDKGEFEIAFFAQPDKSVSKDNNPIFNYEITADITDINGETRSTSTIVSVGYHALTINIGIDSKLDKNSKENKLTLATNNLNGEFVATQGKLKIYKLKEPKNVFRNRPWEAPDYQEISQNEFEKLFPNEVYLSSKEPKKGELVFEKQN
jgi:uncharacterized protein YfaS (alpha-2-macroglobulin family)